MKKDILENLSKIIDEQLSILKEEGSDMKAPEVAKPESLRTVKLEGVIYIDFQNVTIKLQKISSEIHDLFLVIDAKESAQLKNNDIVKIVKKNPKDPEPADTLRVGKELKFEIFRKININYESNQIVGWNI